MVQRHIATNNTGAKLSQLSPTIEYDQSTHSRPTLQVGTSLDDEVSSPPRGFFVSIGYAFLYSFEFVKAIIRGKEKVNSSSEGISEGNYTTSDNEVHGDHSKFSFKDAINWLFSFGRLFVTSGSEQKKIKTKTKEIIDALIDQSIPCILLIN